MEAEDQQPSLREASYLRRERPYKIDNRFYSEGSLGSRITEEIKNRERVHQGAR